MQWDEFMHDTNHRTERGPYSPRPRCEDYVDWCKPNVVPSEYNTPLSTPRQ